MPHLLRRRRWRPARSCDLGDAVGIVAAQSIGEPGTQLTMRTFHTGGVAGADITHGLPRVVELFEARKPKGVAKIAERGRQGRDRGRREGRARITILDAKGEEHAVHASRGARACSSSTARRSTPGQQLNEGSLYPAELLEIRGRDETERYLVKEVQEVYKSQGVDINDKHIELIVRQMLKRVRIDRKGDTDFLPGSLVDRHALKRHERRASRRQSGETAAGEEVILGITKASLATDSFLSAASFQETTKVLTDASLEGKVDRLLGLKENVIIGKLIPAATGPEALPHARDRADRAGRASHAGRDRAAGRGAARGRARVSRPRASRASAPRSRPSSATTSAPTSTSPRAATARSRAGRPAEGSDES